MWDLIAQLFWLIKLAYGVFIRFWPLLPFIILFFRLVRKYSDSDPYGLEIITWEFGGWKSYNLWLDTLAYSQNGFFVISNNPNSFVDLYFDHRSDLEKIFNFLLKYVEITNHQSFIEYGFRPIVFNVDEAHKYFFSRDFKKNMNEENMTILTQIRKRSILSWFITQELAQLDVFFRRLTNGNIKRYYSGLWFIRFWRNRYVPNPETTSLNEESGEASITSKWLYLAPNFLSFLSKNRRHLLPEKWVSKFVVWFVKRLDNLTFKDFIFKLYPLETDFWADFWDIFSQIYNFETFNLTWIVEYNENYIDYLTFKK